MELTWNDLQTIEALVRTGSLVEAARELSLQHSTVSRRIEAIERALGAPLFLRGTRLTPTNLGRSVAERAARMRGHALDVDALLEEVQRDREGITVITTNDVLASLLFGALRGHAFDGRVQVRISDAELKLAPGSVDLALRPSHTPGGSLKGQRLGRLRIGIWKSSDTSSATERWVLPSRSLRERMSQPWWRAIPADADGVIECDSLLGIRDACVAGLGKAVLPAFLGMGDGRLLLEEEVRGGTPVWLLSSATRTSHKRVAALRRALFDALRELPGVWET